MADLYDEKRRFSNHRQWREFIATEHKATAFSRSAAVAADRSPKNWLRGLDDSGRLSLERIQA